MSAATTHSCRDQRQTRSATGVGLVFAAQLAACAFAASPPTPPTLGWRTCLPGTGELLGTAASPRHLAISHGAEGLLFLDVDTGARVTPPVEARNTFDLTFSPDGRSLVAVQRPGGGNVLELVRFDMETGTRTVLASPVKHLSFVGWEGVDVLAQVDSGYTLFRSADGAVVAKLPGVRETGSFTPAPGGGVVLGALDGGRRPLSWRSADFVERGRTTVAATGWTALLAAPSKDEALLAELDGDMTIATRSGDVRRVGRLPPGDRPLSFRRPDRSVVVLTAPDHQPVGECSAVVVDPDGGGVSVSATIPACLGYGGATLLSDGSALFAEVLGDGGREAPRCVQRVTLAPGPPR